MSLWRFNFTPILEPCGILSWGLIPLNKQISVARVSYQTIQRSILWIRRLGAWLVPGLDDGRALRLVSLIGFLVLGVSFARASGRIESSRALHDISSDTDPNSTFWRGMPTVVVDKDANGDEVGGYKMTVRSRWTPNNLYFLFVCSYIQLYLKPDPTTDVETNELWHWDVAEAFIGSDFRDIRRYKEFEISPQGEWVDLDIDLDRREDPHDWKWNSGFKVSARIDPATHRWYGFMKIPYSSVDSRSAAVGNLLRGNFFLSEGAAPNHRAMAWQPTHQGTFHVPKVFGIIELRPAHQ